MMHRAGSLQRIGVVGARAYTNGTKSYELVVCGGGAAGCAIAAKFTKRLGAGKVAVIEPSDKHYYQPMWTLVGGGLKSFDKSMKQMKDVLPSQASWIKDSVSKFEPENNTVVTSNGTKLQYKFLVIALGITLRYDLVPGVVEAMKHDKMVCSNYSPVTVHKTFQAFQQFKGGNALFTFPNTPIKCAGAPQKIMYIFDDYLRRKNLRDSANIQYRTSLGVIFGVKKYAEILLEICKERNIQLHVRNNLVEVRHEKKEAVFEHLDTKAKHTEHYDFLHVTPPMQAPAELKTGTNLTDAAGYVNVNKLTMQHAVYPNIFAAGDCANLPTSKTAAAVAGQVGVLAVHLANAMKTGGGKQLSSPAYDGYTSCPLVTSQNTCVLAEFDYNGQPLETFPGFMNQSKQSKLMYAMKAHFMPELYWYGLLNGYWNGPGFSRKLMHLGMSK